MDAAFRGDGRNAEPDGRDAARKELNGRRTGTDACCRTDAVLPAQKAVDRQGLHDVAPGDRFRKPQIT